MNSFLNPAFSPLDVAVLIAYLATVVLIGALFYRRQSDTHDFFLASRSVNWIAVAISIIATDMSAISFIGFPAFVYQRNLEMLPLSLMLPLLVIPVVIKFFVPFYHRLQLTTVYEYLERRFDARVRTVTGLLFLLLRGVYVGIVIYAPSLVLSVVTGLPLMESVLLMGVFTTIYTMLGGMRAVIWTDVIQFLIFSLGLVFIMSTAWARIEGGWTEIWNTAGVLGKTKVLDFSWDVSREFTLWAVLFGSTFFLMKTWATDQLILQRYLTAGSTREAKKALKLEACLFVPVLLALKLTGLLLAVYYFQHPDKAQGIPKDAVLPYFTIHELPAGLSGLVIAAIFAAAMSTMSGGLNSLATVTMVDFYKRLLRPHAGEDHYLRAARWMTLGWGTVATGIALFANRLGELATASSRANSFLGGVILGIFLLGMLSRKATSLSVLVGASVGLTAVVSVAGVTNISWLWHGTIGCCSTFLCGYLTSVVTRAPAEKNLSGLLLRQSKY